MDDDVQRAAGGSIPGSDLAAIVLGASAGTDDARDRRRTAAPESVPIEWVPTPGASGFDARSVVVLVVVVAALAAVVGWVASGRGEQPEQLPAPSPTSSSTESSSRARTEPVDEASVGDRRTAEATATAARRGVDLVIGRVTAGTAGSSRASVVVGVANRGTVDAPATENATVLVLVDGAVGATAALPAVEAGGGTRADVPLNWCPAGTVPVTVVLDPAAVVREVDERNGSTSRALEFAC